MLKSKLLIALVAASCFSGYASASVGPTVNKTLPVKLAQEALLSVDWEPANLFTNYHPASVLGTIKIASSGLSSLKVLSTSPDDKNRAGRLVFSSDKGWIVSKLYTVSTTAAHLTEITSGWDVTPGDGLTTLPSSFSFQVRSATSSNSGNMPAGIYTATITVSSVVA